MANLYGFDSIEELLEYFIKIRAEYLVKLKNIREHKIPEPYSALESLRLEVNAAGAILERNGYDMDKINMYDRKDDGTNQEPS